MQVPSDAMVDGKRAALLAPGYLIRTYAAAERARKWLREDNPGCVDCDLLFVNSLFSSNRGWGFLSGLVDSLDDGSWIRRRSWWLARAYAQMSGNYVFIDSPDTSVANYDGIASKDSNKVTVLVGNFNEDQPLTVRLDSLNAVPFIAAEKIVQVKAYKVLVDSVAFIGAPDSTSQDTLRDGLILPMAEVVDVQLEDLRIGSMDERYVVSENGTLEIPILNDSGNPDTLSSGEAIILEITSPSFAVHQVPQERSILGEMIALAGLGDTIVVGEGTSGHYDPIVMRPYIQVVAAEGVTPEISASGAGNGPAVSFPPGTNDRSILEGFKIVAGDSTASVVDFQGGGQLIDCTIEDTDDNPNPPNADAPDYLINISTGDQVQIKNSILRDEGAEPGASGIQIGNNADVIIDSCIIDYWGSLNCNGIYAGDPSWIDVKNTLIKGPGTGIHLNNILVTGSIAGCTVDSTHFDGISSQVSNVVPERCIVTHANRVGGVYYGVRGTCSACILPDSVSTPPASNPNTVFEDPLYCPGGYTLRVDSYGNPSNNPTGQGIGAYPVACWTGTLVRDSEFSGDTLTVSNSPWLPLGKTLTLGSGTTLVMTAYQEPQIQGTFIAQGTAVSPVRIQGAQATPGYWETLEFHKTGQGILTYVDIRDAQTALSNRSYYFGCVDSLMVNHCSFSNFSDNGIYLNRATVSDTGEVWIHDTTFDMTGAIGSGLWIGRESNGDENIGPFPGYTITLDGVSVTGDVSGTRGIYINDEGVSTQAQLKNLSVTGLTAGTGIEIGNLSPTLLADSNSSISVADCKVGIKLKGTGSPSIPGPDTTRVTVTGCTTGMEVEATSADIHDVWIQTPAGGTGILTGGQSQASFVDVDIQGGATGMNAQSVAAHPFREGSIIGYSSYGVLVGTAGYPDLGTTGSHGNNNIYTTGYPSSKPVKAKTLGSLGNIQAKYNYWNGPPPSMPNVDVTPWLTSPSTLGATARVKIARVPTALRVRVSANPMRSGRGTVRLELPPDTGRYRLELFGVDGRLVGVLAEGRTETGGVVEVRLGSKLAPGVYFLRLQSKVQSRVTKFVTLP